MTTTFLTKLLVPRRRPGTIRRQRLLDRLNEAPGGTVVVVRSPAGFGKTTLLVDFCEQLAAPARWLTLDEWDRDLAAFLHYLTLAAAGGQEQAAGAEPADERFAEPESVVAQITNQLLAEDRPSYLILDDLHFLDSSPAALAAADLLARRLPPSLVLVIASRTAPPLPSLPRLRAAGAVTDLTPADLAFTRDEASAVWRGLRPEGQSEGALDALLEVTEGWPAAVSLGARAGRLGSSLSSGHLAEYLAAEVYAGLAPELQDFLLGASTLETIDPLSCQQLAPGLSEAAARQAIRHLEAAAIPLTWLTNEPPRLSLHALFREFLQDRLRATDEPRYRELHQAAGRFAEERGMPSEAVRHFREAAAWQSLCKLIDREAPEAYQRGRWSTILAWLESVPERERRASMAVRVWECRVLGRLGPADRALQVIEDAIARFGQSSPATVVELEALRAAALRTKGSVAAAIESARRAKKLAFEVNATLDAVTEARKELGLALMAEGDFTEAVDELSAVLDTESQRGDTARLAYTHGCLGSAYGALGRLAESVHHLERARRGWTDLGNNKELSWVLNNLGLTYWQLGQDEQARQVLSECLVTARQSENRRIEGYALATLGDAERLAGELAAAAGHYDEALAVAREAEELVVESFALAGLADVSRRRRQLEGAEALAREALASAESRGAVYEEGLARLALARILRDAGNRAAAVTEFMRAEGLFQRIGAHKEEAETLLFLADSLLAARSSRSVLAALLARIPELASRVGWHRFLTRHEEAARVAAHAVARRIDSAFYRRLLQPAGDPSADQAPARYPKVVFNVFGAVQASAGGRVIERAEWEAEKSKELTFLMIVLGRPATRDEIISRLWPDYGGSKSVSVFHSTLHRARRALYAEAIVESAGGYVLQPEGAFECDLVNFRELLAAASRAADRGAEIALLQRAVELYSGPVSPSLRGEWVEEERHGAEGAFLQASARLGSLLMETGQFSRAAQVFEAVLRTDSFNDQACVGAMRAHDAAGDRASALRVYERYAGTMRRELGVDPEGAAAELGGALLAGKSLSR